MPCSLDRWAKGGSEEVGEEEVQEITLSKRVL